MFAFGLIVDTAIAFGLGGYTLGLAVTLYKSVRTKTPDEAQHLAEEILRSIFIGTVSAVVALAAFIFLIGMSLVMQPSIWSV